MLLKRAVSSDHYRSYINLIMSKKRPLPTITVPIPLDFNPYLEDNPWNPSVSLASVDLRTVADSTSSNMSGGANDCRLSPEASFAAISAKPFGLEFDSKNVSGVVERLVESKQFELACAVYFSEFVAKGVELDLDTFNSMIICFANMGNCEEARILFDRMIETGFFPSGKASEGYIFALIKRGMFLEAFDSLHKLTASKQRLSANIYDRIIDGLCSSGSIDKVRRAFDKFLERSGLKPTLSMFKNLYYGYCKQGLVVEAETIFQQMEAFGFSVDKVMYTSLINVCCKKKKIGSAIRIFLRMIKMGCKHDAYTLKTLIHGFVNVGLFERAWDLCEKLSETDRKDDFAYYLMMTRYCKEGKIDCAETLLSLMENRNLNPRIRYYTNLISALSMECRQHDIELLLSQMLNADVIPDHVLFLVLLRTIQKGDELELCLIMLRSFSGSESSLPSCLQPPSPLTVEQEIKLLLEELVQRDIDLANIGYSIYITSLCRQGRIDDALSCLKTLVDDDDGCRPLLFAFNSVIKCLCCNDLFDDAKTLIKSMQAQNISPNNATYLVRIKEHCRRKDPDAALGLMMEMKARGLNPKVNIYDSIVGCLCEVGRISEAETMFKEMIDSDLNPDKRIYTTMVRGYFMNKKPEDGLLLYKAMLKNSIRPSRNFNTVLLTGLIYCNLDHEACEYALKMLSDGLDSNLTLCTSLVHRLFRRNELHLVFRIIDSILSNNVDTVFYTVLLSEVCRMINWTKRPVGKVNAKLLGLRHYIRWLSRKSTYSRDELELLLLKLLKHIKQANLNPDLYLHNLMILGFCKTRRTSSAYKQFFLMLEDGIHPNDVTLTFLMDAHLREGQISQAIAMFNNVLYYGYEPDKLLRLRSLKTLHKEGKHLGILCLIYTMQKRGCPPSKLTYYKALGFLCAGGFGIAALRLFEDMMGHGYLPGFFLTEKLIRLFVTEKNPHSFSLFDYILDIVKNDDNLTQDFSKRVASRNNDRS